MKKALISVYDKTGIITFARGLIELGWEILASGGTAERLREGGLEVTDIATVTGSPEMLGGRVKSLHPAIHAGILAQDTADDRRQLRAHEYPMIDLVTCNLYPFQTVVDQAGTDLSIALDNIDIGGVTLLRAAAKNFTRVTVIGHPADYSRVLNNLRGHGQIDITLRQELATEAFRITHDYDAAIAGFFSVLNRPLDSSMPETLRLDLVRVQALRYGENPHQDAALYALDGGIGPLGGTLLQGKPLSYNNLLDLDAARRALKPFARPAVTIVKHLSPCGLAKGASIAEAFPLALASDPKSAFGGVIAVNRTVDEGFAAKLADADLFVEAITAPGFSAEARAWFAAHKKRCRLLEIAGEVEDTYELRSVAGGYLLQVPDHGDINEGEYQAVSARQPTPDEWRALRFAWQVIPSVRSNAIVLATATATVGIGGGLPSRVDAVELALRKAGDRARGAAMASDAFFPFADGVQVAAAAAVTAVIQPGGSVNDEQVIAAADSLDMAMVFTGQRHFRH